MEKIIYIVAGGPGALIPDLQEYQGHNAIWIGVDYGVFYLIKQGINPDVAFGDFDSVSEQEWEVISKKTKKIMEYNSEKDATDMELALLWALTNRPSKINIFGATGGRADHYFANAFMLGREECLNSDSLIEIIDCQNIISAHLPGSYTVDKIDKKKYISFIPVTKEVSGITLLGFKYPLNNKKVSQGSSLGISNELLEDCGTFSFSEGILLMIRSND
jgi:thiamine pyrophosphokinase